MFKNLTGAYCLVISVITTIGIIIAIGIIIQSGTTLFAAEYKFIDELNKFSSDEKYAKYLDNQFYDKYHYNEERSNISYKSQCKIVSLEQISKERIIARSNYIEELKGGAIGTIIHCSSWLITFLTFFIIHCMIYKKLHSSFQTK